jgi:CrcB protein
MSTYSAFAVQTHRAGLRRGAVYATATIALSLAACGLGFWVGQA